LNEWTVPGYTELKPLGSGGFGSVVLARHDATGTAVAVKYLLPALRQDPEFAALFRAEAEALGALDDPHVVRLYEYVESAAGAAIVMELIDGVTLWDILSQHGRTTPEAALVVLYGSLLGLAAAHARGVVHRDFKPRNVLVNAYGASKLTDFGIAARAGTPTIPSGSVAYAPPEQFDGGPASPASDVYAATATFYECLAGRPPFTGPTIDAVIWQHQSAEVPMDPVPAPLQPIVARGMAKDPGYRPADAAALAAGLRAAAANAYGPDWEQRGRSQLGAAAVLLAALWPSAGVPALHVASLEQVHLSQGAQHAHSVQAAHHPATKAALHRWHLRHVLHLDHLARTAAVTVTTAAVVAAAVTVAATSRAPGGPGGTPAHPAVAAYHAPLAPPATISATLTGGASGSAPGETYMFYEPGTLLSTAYLSGEVKDATTGEVARLYAQQFPFTSPPAPVQSVTVNPGNGTLNPNNSTGTYTFNVTPTLATRYQVRLLQSATSATPLAVSAIRTIYTVGYTKMYINANGQEIFQSSCANQAGQVVCTQTIPFLVYSPPSALQTEMSKRKYVYVDFDQASLGTPTPYTTTLHLDTQATISTPRRVADNEYEVNVSFSYNGNQVAAPTASLCTEQTEAQDGIGLPGPSACGSASIPETASYIWGNYQ
jgi:hypothetical protein